MVNTMMAMLAQATQPAAGPLDKLGIALGVAGLMIGVGLIVMGAARGIGNIGGNAVESIARQPEAKGSIGTNMIIAAALIEGFTFFALIIGLLALNNLR